MTFLTCREDEIVLFRCVGERGGDPVGGWNDNISLRFCAQASTEGLRDFSICTHNAVSNKMKKKSEG